MRILLLLLILIAIASALFLVRRARSAALRNRRRDAWHAKREEEDRIWYEKTGEEPGEGGLPIKPDRESSANGS